MTISSKKLVLPINNYIQAMFSVAFWPWVAIIFSWSFFIVSVISSFEVPSSGAVLVCGALIAEIFYYNQRWTKMNTDPSGSFTLVPNSNTGLPVIRGQFLIAPVGSGKLGVLLSLAKEHEVRDISTGTIWHYNDTVARVEKIIFTVIVITAVSGTALWGYGHLYF